MVPWCLVAMAMNRLGKWLGRFFDFFSQGFGRFRSVWGFPHRYAGVNSVGDMGKHIDRKKPGLIFGFVSFWQSKKILKKVDFRSEKTDKIPREKNTSGYGLQPCVCIKRAILFE